MTPASLKARRLLAGCRVQPKGNVARYEVDGDHGTYLVLIGEGFAFCSCPANRERCSHVEACEHLDLALRTEGLHGEAV